ncbi:autophagy-related protein 13-like [Babylonia areolata]|uniref:autophagy-related protein 13-like n=1 Tax=Babylonia areolata TaxID=304850 RepID=UPI003FD36847
MALQSELDKYTRNFVLKSLQVIVQSRMGEKCRYTVKENSSLEWFTLPIPDIPELSAVARKTLGSGPVLAQPVNVEISLKTKENNAYIFLEVWSLSLDVDNCDPDVKVSSTLYGRMTSALKSIICVSRVAPAYRLAQRQKKDDFQIHYQYKVGPPNLGILMEDVQTRRIGAVATPMGTIQVTFSYTTKPQMPQQPRSGIPLFPKIDHFSEPSLGQVSEPKPCNRKFRNPTSVEDLRYLDSQEKQDTFNSTFSTSPPEGTVCSLSPPPPLAPLPQINEASATLTDSIDGLEEKADATSGKEKKKKKRKETAKKSPQMEPVPVRSVFMDVGVQPVPSEKAEEVPFATLMAGLSETESSVDDDTSDISCQEEEKEGERGKKKEEVEAKSKEKSDDDDDSGAEEGEEEGERSNSPSDDSFVMLESPFREAGPAMDLGQFFHQMQLAPMAQLSMMEQTTVRTEDFLKDVKEQIDRYAALQPHFDKFVKSLGRPKDDSDSD